MRQRGRKKGKEVKNERKEQLDWDNKLTGNRVSEKRGGQQWSREEEEENKGCIAA